MFNFEKLESWKVAIEFAGEIYEITRTFPQDERFGLISQMRRSSVSISANLAEGNGRNTTKEFKRFIEIAYGSLMETVSHTVISHRQKFLSKEDYDRLYE